MLLPPSQSCTFLMPIITFAGCCLCILLPLLTQTPFMSFICSALIFFLSLAPPSRLCMHFLPSFLSSRPSQHSAGGPHLFFNETMHRQLVTCFVNSPTNISVRIRLCFSCRLHDVLCCLTIPPRLLLALPHGCIHTAALYQVTVLSCFHNTSVLQHYNCISIDDG